MTDMNLSYRKYLTVAAATFTLLVPAGRILAQGTTITGRVTAEGSNLPLADASVLMLGTNLSALTGADGRYTIRNAKEGRFDLQVLRVGYRGQKKSVQVIAGSTANIDFVLPISVVQLQEVVTTATGQQRRVELGNAVSTLGAVSKIVEGSRISSVSDLLIAKSPGVVVLPNTTLGGAPSVRIRGTSSISLSNAPIFYVDGVRYAANTLSSGTDTQFSLLNSLNPEEIEDVEIVKGPSAATLYGTNAANGVVVITTKKGRAGRTNWNYLAENGTVNDRVPYPDMYANWGHSPTNPSLAIRCQLSSMVTTANPGGICVSDSLTSYNYLRDPTRTFLKDGNRQLYGTSVSGGTEVVRFFASADAENEIGPIQMPGYEIQRFDSLKVKVVDQWKNPLAMSRKSFRGNVSAALSPKFDLSLSTGFNTLYNRIPPESDLIIALLYVGIQNYGFKGPGLDKIVNQSDGTPLHDAFQFAPGDIMQNINESTVLRTTMSSNASWRPISWMQNDGTVGMDLAGTDFFQICHLNECPPANATARAGRVTDNKTNFKNLSGKISSTATWNARPWANFKTSIGGDYTNVESDFTNTNGVTLPPGGGTVGAASTRNASQQQPTAVKTLGLYVQEQLGLRDRLFLTAAVRTDQNSAFGTNFQSVYYPKASLSWLLSDESFFPHFRWLNQLRVRGAYGASGVQPGATAALVLFNPGAVTIAARGATSASDLPGLTASQPGNANLKPEKSGEYEAGFEGQAVDNRLRFDFTYYNKTTHDALIAINLAPSSAAAQLTPLQNIGSTNNRGIEAQLNAQLVDTRYVGFDLQLSGSHNTSEILDLGIDPNTGQPRILRTSTQGGEARQIVGLPLNGMWYRPYTYHDDNGDGILQVAEVHVDSAFKYYGYRTPRNLVSVQTGIDLFRRKLRINALFDHKGGGSTQDGANNFQCTTGPFACRETEDPRAPLALQARAIAKTYGTPIGGTTFKTSSGYFLPNDFWKWRELSAVYVLPDQLIRAVRAQNGSSIVFAARNLRTWTKFTGYDPEANYGLTQSDGQNEFQTNGAPTYYTVRINLKY
jgi:TonB-linked SusC/RagA family outer membrane protein